MVFNSRLYEQYIRELRMHLFERTPIEDIIKGIHSDHRKRRFMIMFVLQSKQVFHRYYAKRSELHMERLFDQVLSGMFYETERHPLKHELIRRLELSPDMIAGDVSTYEIREVAKDLNSFALYQRKRT